MSDTPAERISNSKSNLIGVQHVGVTTQLHTPLRNLRKTYNSSTETDNSQIHYCGCRHTNTKYNKFKNDHNTMGTESTPTDASKALYEMKALQSNSRLLQSRKLTPSKIEFQLYNRTSRPQLRKTRQSTARRRKSHHRLFENFGHNKLNTEASLFKRLRRSLNNRRTHSRVDHPAATKRLPDFPEPQFASTRSSEVHIGIYPFDHGHADYLQTHENPPQALSVILAERTIGYATRFWSEFFGSIHIGVAFVITFILQTYRFLLYSLVNTLLVGILHMTSDYLLKPILTALFNGFVQPPIIFCFNVLSSVRDVLEPVADTLNNFMKPLATVGRSVRLVDTTYNKRNIKETV